MPNYLLIGQRRQGKSTLALAIASVHARNIVIFDPNHNYRSPAFDVVTPDTLDAWMEAGADIEANGEAKQYRIAKLGPYDQGDIWNEFSRSANVLWGWDDYVFIVDESVLLQTSSKIHPDLDRFLRRSPADTHVIQTGHRFYELASLSRYMVDEVYIFRNELPRERQLIGELYSPELVEIVNQLGDREYVKFARSNAGRGYYYRQPDGAIWNVELRNPNRRPEDTRKARQDSTTAATGVRKGEELANEPEPATDDGDSGGGGGGGGGSILG